MSSTPPQHRFRKSQLRDPKVLALASRGVVEIITGEDDGVAMLPWRAYVNLRRVLDYAAGFVQLSVAAEHPDTPRALLGDYAFFADFDQGDRVRFMEAFGEAVAESIRLGDPRPVAFLIDAYRTVAKGFTVSSEVFSGEMSPEVEERLSAKVPRR
jgi:hypothetical protein